MLVAIDQAHVDCEAWFLAQKTKEATTICLELFDTCVKMQYNLRGEMYMHRQRKGV